MFEPFDARQFHQFGDAPFALAVGNAADFQAVADIVADIHIGKQRVGLKHHADIAPFDRHPRHVGVVEQESAAGVRRLEPGNDAKQRGLAAAGRTEQHQGLAARDMKRHRFERTRAVGKGLAAGLDAERDTVAGLLARSPRRVLSVLPIAHHRIPVGPPRVPAKICIAVNSGMIITKKTSV